MVHRPPADAKLRRAKVKAIVTKQKEAEAKANRDALIKTPERQTINNMPPPIIEPPSSPSVSPPLNRHTPVVKTTSTEFPAPQPRSAQPIIGQVQSHHQLLPPVSNVNMNRRVSLAGGEAAMIETWAAKRAQKRSPGVFVSPRSPPILQNQGAFARRSSTPYPPINPVILTQPSPKSPRISPSVRPMPSASALHLTAMRNNSRRASMPGVPQIQTNTVQLIYSAPFTPPRTVSAAYPTNRTRELSPIKDHDAELHHSDNENHFADTDFATTYLTPPSSTYHPTTSPVTSYFADSGSSAFDFSQPIEPFTPNAPLPNADFSFGISQGLASGLPDQDSIFATMQQRSRIGSIASIDTFTTDGARNDGSEFGFEWAGLGLETDLEGFHPDARRASA